LGRALKRLLGTGNIRDERWYNVLVLRILIAPFTLRRTIKSTWDGQWVIDRSVVRPQPEIIPPATDDKATKAAEAIYCLGRKDTTLAKVMEKADKQRWYAWSPIYQHVLMGSEDSTRDFTWAERVIVEKFRDAELTGRMKRFISIIKGLVRKGKRFIIVSDRIFPLQLVYYVHPSANFLMVRSVKKCWG